MSTVALGEFHRPACMKGAQPRQYHALPARLDAYCTSGDAGRVTDSLGALTPDAVNRARWASEHVLAQFERVGSDLALDCWTDSGERAAFMFVADTVRSVPVLDIGVGGGRTTTILRLLSSDYLGIDYLPEMVTASHRNHPDSDIRLGDVRTLSMTGGNRFGFVVFSNNGLDAMDHGDRQVALNEISRVTRAGGMFLFSTHNKAGPCYGASPLKPAGSPNAHAWSRSYRYGRRALSMARAPIQLPRSLANWLRIRRSAIDGGDWAIGPVEAHEFGLLIHYVTLDGATRELAAAGFELVRVFAAENGRRLKIGTDLSRVRYFHIVAKKTALTS